jgi:inward rectifier potassium channel
MALPSRPSPVRSGGVPSDGTGRQRVTRLTGSGREVVSIGLRNTPLRDLYHSLLTTTWSQFFGLVLAAYLGANLIFASGYLAIGDGIEEARPGNFSDAFFFSVQTMATIGYGKMAPRGLEANLLVTMEALVGLLGLALVTGLVFAKFSRPTARVLFSRNAVITTFDGVPSLLFRMANERGNQIAEAQAHLVLLRTERTPEGEEVRRVHDLRLRRGQSAFFAFTWLVVHPITPDSPLFGETAATMQERDLDLVASVTGLDETLSQSVHARHSWSVEQILWRHRFVDVLVTLPDGRRAIDYRKFHEVAPDDPRPSGQPPG